MHVSLACQARLEGWTLGLESESPPGGPAACYY